MRDTQGDKIYIGGLAQNVLQQDLEKEFKRFGKIRDTWVAKHPPGFGFVQFEYPQDAKKAIRVMDGKTLFGQQIKVEAAKAKDHQQPRQNSSRNSSRVSDRPQSRRKNDGRRQNSSREMGRERNRNTAGRKRPRPETPPLERRLLASLPPLPPLRKSDVVESLDRLSASLGLTRRRSPSPSALRRRLDLPSSLQAWSPPLPPFHLGSTRELSPSRLTSRRLTPPRALGTRPLSPLDGLGERNSRRLSPLRSLDSRRLSPLRSGSLRRLSPLRSLDAHRRLSPHRATSPLRSLLPRDLLLEEEIVKRLGRDKLRRGDFNLGDLGTNDSLSGAWKRSLPSPPSLLPPLPRYRSRSPIARRRSPLQLLPPLPPLPPLRDVAYPARDYRSGRDYEGNRDGDRDRVGNRDADRDRVGRQNRPSSNQNGQGRRRDSWDRQVSRDRGDGANKGAQNQRQLSQVKGKRIGGRRRDNKKGVRNRMPPPKVVQQPAKGRGRRQPPSAGRRAAKKARNRALGKKTKSRND